MSKRLKVVVEEYIAKNGHKGSARLVEQMDRSYQTIQRWLREGFPSQHEAFKLAVACGCAEKDALAMARECFAKAG